MISFDEITEGSGGGSADLLPIYQSVNYLLNCCNDVQSSMSIFQSNASILSSSVDSLLSDMLNANSEISILQSNTESIWEQVSTMSGGANGVFVTLHSDWNNSESYYFVNSVDNNVNLNGNLHGSLMKVIDVLNEITDNSARTFAYFCGDTLSNCFNTISNMNFNFYKSNQYYSIMNSIKFGASSNKILFGYNGFTDCFKSLKINSLCLNASVFSNCFRNIDSYNDPYFNPSVNFNELTFKYCFNSMQGQVNINPLSINGPVYSSTIIPQALFININAKTLSDMHCKSIEFNTGLYANIWTQKFNYSPIYWNSSTIAYFKLNYNIFQGIGQNNFCQRDMRFDHNRFSNNLINNSYVNYVTICKDYDYIQQYFTKNSTVLGFDIYNFKNMIISSAFMISNTFQPLLTSASSPQSGYRWFENGSINLNLPNALFYHTNIFKDNIIITSLSNGASGFTNYSSFKKYNFSCMINRNKHPAGYIFSPDNYEYEEGSHGLQHLKTFMRNMEACCEPNKFSFNVADIEMFKLQKLTSKNITNYSALTWAFIKEDNNSNVWSRSGLNAPYEQFIKNGIPLGLDAFINRTPTGSTYRATFAFNQNFSNAATSIYTCYPYLSHLVFWSPGGGNDVSAFNKWCDGNGNWLTALPNLKRLDIIVRDASINVPIFTLTNSAFANGFNLRTINFWLDVYETQGENIELKVNADCFKNCFNLREVNVRYLSPQTDTFTTGYNMIASGAFSNCGLTRVDLNWANIGQNAYAGCHPAEIWINSTRLTSQGTDWNKYLTYYGIDTDTNNYIYTIFPYA